MLAASSAFGHSMLFGTFSSLVARMPVPAMLPVASAIVSLSAMGLWMLEQWPLSLKALHPRHLLLPLGSLLFFVGSVVFQPQYDMRDPAYYVWYVALTLCLLDQCALVFEALRCRGNPGLSVMGVFAYLSMLVGNTLLAFMDDFLWSQLGLSLFLNGSFVLAGCGMCHLIRLFQPASGTTPKAYEPVGLSIDNEQEVTGNALLGEEELNDF